MCREVLIQPFRLRCKELPHHTDQFAAVYGEPEKCYADYGNQILAGANRLESTTGTEARKTQRVFTATGCKGRNGEAEGTIRSVRRTLVCVLEKGGKYMDFQEMNEILKRVGEILNRRLLVVEVGQDDQYYAITAADLLLGRASEAPAGTEGPTFRETEEKVKETLTAPEKLAREWWEKCTQSNFPTLVPRTQWKTSSRNVQVGDIALLRYTTNYNAPSYRLYRIVGVKVGEDGQVRRCDVALGPRRKGEDHVEKYQHKKLATKSDRIQLI